MEYEFILILDEDVWNIIVINYPAYLARFTSDLALAAWIRSFVFIVFITRIANAHDTAKRRIWRQIAYFIKWKNISNEIWN